MIISYCLNPKCSQPKNHPKLKKCHSCGCSLILHQRYRAIKVLGKGGFGATFIGVDLNVQSYPLCVIKQLRPTTDEPKAIETAISLFQREANILDKIDHPQIPKLMDYFEEKGQFYLIQQLINGHNLQREIKNNGVYGELKIRRFLEEITPIIKYVHSQKIIHRDIKPGNILRRKKDDKLILIDFGAVKDQVNTQLAKTLGETDLTKFSFGTMGYAPPEQLAMRPIYSSDIYALGATCVYLLTAKSPRKFKIDIDTGNMMWQQETNISNYLKKIIEKMLAADIRDRFRTIDELMDVLDIQPLENNLVQTKNLSADPSDDKDSRDYKEDLESSFPPSQLNLGDFTSTQISKTISPAQKLQQAIYKRRQEGKRKKNLVRWNEFKFFAASDNGKRDFSDQNLRRLNLEGGEFSQYIFRYAKLQKVTFTKANLSQANFYGANLSSANFKQATLVQTYFSKSNLQNANFKGANLTSADFTNANLNGVNLCGANLKNAKINQQQLETAKVNWKTTFPDGSKRWWKFF